MKNYYFKNGTNSIYDKIEMQDFYSYLKEKTKLQREDTLKNVFFYIKDFMCFMSEKSAFDITTKSNVGWVFKNSKRGWKADYF